jgi:phosphoribosylamine--glycine ligase
MRILGITETCDLGSMYMRLMADGHDVRVTVSEPLAAETMLGLVPRANDWRQELAWVQQAGEEGIIIFEATGFGALQDQLRRDGCNVIGGSALGDRLETDRTFALELLGAQGLHIARVRQFTDAQAAVADLHARPRRCVFKVNASDGQTFVGSFPDGSDVAALLSARIGAANHPFILMDFMDGIETGVGAYFDGTSFLQPACVDWEHKRFFAGDMGELTGEMGTVATFDGSGALFTETLKPLEPLLREAGHVGWVNLNTIINEEGIWPLEFTCRFGYPGFAVLEPLQACGWTDLFRAMAGGHHPGFHTHAGFSLGVVLSTPPFPYSRKDLHSPVGLPVLVGDIAPEQLHLGEVGMAGTQLVTSGIYGWTAVVTGTGATVEAAKAAAYASAAQVHAPNIRYRMDIGDKLIAGELSQLKAWGWL